VVDVIELELLVVKDSFKLPVIPDISPDAIFPICVVKIESSYFMASALQFIDQIGAYNWCL